MLVLLNIFTILGSSNLPISKHCWAPRHHSTCTFAFSTKDLHPSAFSCLKKQESARRIHWKKDSPLMCFFGWYISQNHPFSHLNKICRNVPTVGVFLLRLQLGATLAAYVTSNFLQFQSISGGLVNQRLQILPFCFLRNVSNPKLLGWILSAAPVVRLVIGWNANWRANGTEIQATFSCGLRFPLPLPLPLKANLSPGVVEAPLKHPAKHPPRAPKHWRHHHAIIVGHHALHNQRKPDILDKRSFPHPIIIHHRISNHWKKTVGIQQHDDFRPKKNLKPELWPAPCHLPKEQIHRSLPCPSRLKNSDIIPAIRITSNKLSGTICVMRNIFSSGSAFVTVAALSVHVLSRKFFRFSASRTPGNSTAEQEAIPRLFEF